MNSYRPHLRVGFSLLEVILAIALSVVVIYVVVAGLDFHLRQLAIRKTGIEESQLARAVLRRVADDLRAVVVSRTVSVSPAKQALGDVTGGAEGGGPDDEEATSAASEIISSVVPVKPGIYGNAYELQIDVSRLPRYEEYAFADVDVDMASTTHLSDVKTVSYFLIGGRLGSSGFASSQIDANNLDTLGLSPEVARRGLARRTIDRSAAQYATENANFAYLDQQVELIAPEVQMIEFRYFDGEQWLVEWDTDYRQGIPLAVEIVVVMADPDEIDAEAQSQFSSPFAQNPEQYYRLVVHLPAFEELPPLDELSADSVEEQ